MDIRSDKNGARKIYREEAKNTEENKDTVTSKREWLRERGRGWGEGERGLESEKRRKKKVRFINNWNVFRQCKLRKTSVYLDTKSINYTIIFSVTVTVIPPCSWVLNKNHKYQTKRKKKKNLYCETFKTLLAISSIGCWPNIYSSVYLRISRMSSKDQTTLDLC